MVLAGSKLWGKRSGGGEETKRIKYHEIVRVTVGVKTWTHLDFQFLEKM